jgi:hypothetical protein
VSSPSRRRIHASTNHQTQLHKEISKKKKKTRTVFPTRPNSFNSAAKSRTEDGLCTNPLGSYLPWQITVAVHFFINYRIFTTNTALEITEINCRIMYCEGNTTASSDFLNMSNRLSKWQHNDLQPKLSAMADNCGCDFFFTIHIFHH